MTEPEDSAADAPLATHRGLRAEAERIRAAGLTPDEALLVAARRLAGGDPEVRVFARERFAGIWDEPEPDAGLTDSDERGTERRGFWIMAAFAAAAAVAVRLPEAFGFSLTDSDDASFYARNVSLLVLPALAGWFVWLQRPPRWAMAVIVAVFATSAAVINAYPFDDDSSTFVLAALHLPVLLWLVVGLARTGERWRLSGPRMDYVRFTGEWIVYGALIALAGAVFSALTVGAFVALDVDTRWMTEWVMVAGAAGAVVVTAWLVEFWAGAVSKFASMLAYIFTPLFAAMLVVFLVAVPATGRNIEGEREALILFNVLLGLVVGLLLFCGAARRPSDRPGFFDGAAALLAAAGLLTAVLTLAAVIGRIADFGWSPNRAAIAGINAIFLVNLAGSVWLYIALWRRQRPFDDLVRWQTAHLSVYAAWAAVVVVAFPPIFGFA
ncbi:MAG: hypothetical protein F4155_11205 [Acidimicrobiales bacterium]|nr:hypothetical protein [Acidimicrobiales bacterium]MYH75354.1 hypothetical protein [Acidimicrobiales bacterium]MYK71342.1 hypothetical protein [Acidimicrobiales bacterium]